MATPVWTWAYAKDGFQVRRQRSAIVHNLGNGHIVVSSRSTAWNHQDGTGGSDVSYAGVNVFTVRLAQRDYGSDFTGPLDFLQARFDAGMEAFYLYDPNVTPNSANWDGVTVAGRHLVRHLDEEFGWKMSHYQNSAFDSFRFHEVRP